VAMADILHYNRDSVQNIKNTISNQGIPVRLNEK